MGKKRLLHRPLAAVLAVTLGFAALWGAYRVGWNEGYRLGWLVERTQGDAVPAPEDQGYNPSASPRGVYGSRWSYGPWSGHRTGLARPLLTTGLLLLAFAGLFKLLRIRAWKHAWHHHGPHAGGHPPHGPWAHGPHRGPTPPWCWGQAPAAQESQDPTEEQVAKVQPDPDTE